MTSQTIPPDAMLVERIAALGDKAALLELDARHGMTLYAIAYAVLLNPDAADGAVAAVLREVWRTSASFSARHGSVRRWLGDLASRTAHDRLRRPVNRSSVTAPGRTRGRAAA